MRRLRSSRFIGFPIVSASRDLASSAGAVAPLPAAPRSGVGDDGRSAGALENLDESARLVNREDDYWNPVVPRKGDGRGVHHLEPHRQHLVMGQTLEPG